ncbi:MAG TPA: serine/threonine-protein kinase, partial [Gemmatimonadota bacterium]|nr:serine/threonine-protein kinase [Gemmatimonadota bacterium]
MTDGIDRIRHALSDRYAIERELGSGGMATVYLARDVKHERKVAVKVMRPELTAAVGAERFLREIRITAQLNHPHILPLHDSGEAEGLLYYVMPYVAAGSLRRRLASEDPLAVEESVSIVRQVASALDHAHRHGVIHRDVKPENILFSEGLPVVADFGIAKAVSEAERGHLTRTGVPVGTPGYMSPEQAMGHLTLSERTDVYSLSCVAYEMLIGAVPAVWSAHDSQRLGRFVDAPPEHRERLDLLPGRIEQALVRGLAVNAADRFAQPGEFADALAGALEKRATYDDEQLREILKRAAELQAEQPTQDSVMTIGTIEQVAAEVGIPPEHVREAVKQVERPPTVAEAAPLTKWGPFDKPQPTANVPGWTRTRLLVEESVAGEASPATHEALVREIESALDTIGHASTLGRSLTWSPARQGKETRKVVVTVTPGGGQTRVRIEELIDDPGFAPALGGGFGG